MDISLIFKAIILGIVEGFTEFLPVSSTGHLILMSDLLNFQGEKSKIFVIVIQFAAILAICWEYRARVKQVVCGLPSDPAAQRFATNLMVAFMTAAVLGLLFSSKIKAVLFSPIPVACALIIGGFIILWAEKRQHTIRIQSVDELTWQDSLKLGCFQACALIPGTSRSGATIIGGLLMGLSRKAAIEFSFFLAIPTMFAATAYEIIKNRHLFAVEDIGVFAAGAISTFISAFLCVRWLLRYLNNHDFTIFAYYRIVFGLVVLGMAYAGIGNWAID